MVARLSHTSEKQWEKRRLSLGHLDMELVYRDDVNWEGEISIRLDRLTAR